MVAESVLSHHEYTVCMSLQLAECLDAPLARDLVRTVPKHRDKFPRAERVSIHDVVNSEPVDVRGIPSARVDRWACVHTHNLSHIHESTYAHIER